VSRPNVQRAQAAPQGQNFNMPWPNKMQFGGHQMMPPQMGQGQNPAMGWQQMMQQPNRRMMPPHMPQGPGPQMHPNMGQARGHQMMPQGMAQGRQNAMRAPFQLQARKHLMQQRFAPQGRGAAMAMRMQFRKHLMQQPYLQHGRNSAMRQFMQMRGGARPMMGPNAAGQPQCPKMRPNASCPPQCPQMRPNAAGPKPQVIRPKVEAAKQANAATGDVAKIRHLRQAAEHLADAGLAEPAAKARAEADRMTAALKAQPQAVKPQVKPTQAQPKPDVNAAILGELKKMGRQMEEMNARVRKLEAQEKAVR
jgi:hypothetical protein